MIEFQNVVKVFPGGVRAVDALDLTVEKGEISVLIGPSGCGKTTSMRLVNRLIPLTSGRITVEGRDILEFAPEELRRKIGYAIQQIGLFPHMTVAQNVAVVPRLLGWEERRIRERVDALLELVGLHPDVHREVYPRQLSGGQQQRVGVARALGADPPIMLMDEPFGAVDPITRSVLQDEFLQIQSTIAKTVLFVTHDIDEAIKMGDRVAVMRAGKLVQYATPDELLAQPEDDFVRAFVGGDRHLKRLGLVQVRDVMAEPDEHTPDLDGETVPDHTSVRDALSVLVGRGFDATPVVDAEGRVCGVITLRGLRAAVRRAAEERAAEERAAEERAADEVEA